MTEQVTEERIAEIRARLSNITPPPWAWESIAEKSNEFAVGTAFDAQGTQLLGRLQEGEWVEDTIIERRGLIGMNESGHARFADADFIAHAPNDIRDLLLALDAATAERDEARAVANAADDAACGLKVSDFMLSFPPVRRVDDLRIRAEAAEAELARLRAQGTWQPIETAPKDREVLLFGPKEFNRNSIVQGAWNAGGAMHMAFWMGGIYKPTHWQPLPAPPEHGGCMTTPQTPPPPMTTLVWKARHDLVQAAGARMEAERDALREALMQVQRCLQDPDEQRGLLKAERVIAAALAATSEPPRQRTSQQYQCDHCRGIWLVEADEHHPRGCTLTNCNGTQSPVTTRDHMLAAPPATGEQP